VNLIENQSYEASIQISAQQPFQPLLFPAIAVALVFAQRRLELRRARDQIQKTVFVVPDLIRNPVSFDASAANALGSNDDNLEYSQY
jgi:hypothetical protein